MARRFHIIAVTVFAVSVVVSSCSKLSTVDNGSGGNSPPSTPAVSTAEIQAIYPHTEEFKSTALHGQHYVKNGATCRVCHGQDLAGAATKISCASCHDIFPHNEEFKTKTHGAAFMKNRDTCSHCHGTDFRGGDIGVSCTTCHSYPHDPKWALPKNHGDEYVKELNQPSPTPSHPWVTCQVCHSSTAAESANRVSCDSCHVMVPHSDDFINGGHMTIAGTHEGGCLNCHSGYTHLMGPDYSSCNDCHSGLILQPMSWVAPSPSPSAPKPSSGPGREPMSLRSVPYIHRITH